MFVIFALLQALDIGVKWPNDIYANKKHKIGGVLVSSTVTNNTIVCNIGNINFYPIFKLNITISLYFIKI